MLDSLADTLLRIPALAVLVCVTAGCQTGYVLEQGYRHFALSSRQVPLDSVELRSTLSAEDLDKLRWVPEIVRFCEDELGLEPGGSYQTMLSTGGEPVSHVVTAAHPLALIPYQWAFPFVGTVAYKGYFDPADAIREARRIREAGYEVQVWPVVAFSTLGWFRDPVLETMLEGSVADLADVIIHETTHRTIYFARNTSFNESLATHMGREGTVRFLFSHPELRHSLRSYLEGRRRQQERERLLLRLQGDLDALYRSALPDDAKRARKREIFETATAAYRLLDPEHSEAEIPASNAFVLSVSRYHEHERLLLRLQGVVGGEPADLVAYLKGLSRSRDPLPAVTSELAAINP